MESDFFIVGTKVQLYPGDSQSKFATILEINEFGFVFQITLSYSSDYKNKDIIFISHSKPLSMKIVRDEK